MRPNYAEVPASTWSDAPGYVPGHCPSYVWTDEQRDHLVPGTLVRSYDGDVMLVGYAPESGELFDVSPGTWWVRAKCAPRNAFDPAKGYECFGEHYDAWELSYLDPSTITLPSECDVAPWLDVGRRPSVSMDNAKRGAAQRRVRMSPVERDEARKNHVAFIGWMRNIGEGEEGANG